MQHKMFLSCLEMEASLSKTILVPNKIDMLDLDSSPTSLTGLFLAVVLFAFSFDADSFVLDDGTCVGRLCLDFVTFQVGDTGLGMGQ